MKNGDRPSIIVNDIIKGYALFFIVRDPVVIALEGLILREVFLKHILVVEYCGRERAGGERNVSAKHEERAVYLKLITKSLVPPDLIKIDGTFRQKVYVKVASACSESRSLRSVNSRDIKQVVSVFVERRCHQLVEPLVARVVSVHKSGLGNYLKRYAKTILDLVVSCNDSVLHNGVRGLVTLELKQQVLRIVSFSRSSSAIISGKDSYGLSITTVFIRVVNFI